VKDRDVVCGKCGCEVMVGDTRVVDLSPDTSVRRWDRRPKTPTGGRLCNGARPGWLEMPKTVRVCWRCDPGRCAPPPAPAPLWRQARSAWDTPEGKLLALRLKMGV
jgi:hypothetical protein